MADGVGLELSNRIDKNGGITGFSKCPENVVTRKIERMLPDMIVENRHVEPTLITSPHCKFARPRLIWPAYDPWGGWDEMGALIKFVFWTCVLIMVVGWWTYDPKVAEQNRINAETERAATAVREAEAKKQEDERCAADLDCAVKKHLADAIVECKPAIQSLARTDYQWESMFSNPVFKLWGWNSQKKGFLIFKGDAVNFQNGFGNWIRHKYDCIFNTRTGGIERVEAFPGRL